MISIEKDDDGYYAHIPAVQGCYAQGDTYLEALGNLKEVLQLILEEEGEGGGGSIRPGERREDMM